MQLFKHQYDKKIHHKMLVKILSFNSKKKIITIIMNENNVIYLKMLVKMLFYVLTCGTLSTVFMKEKKTCAVINILNMS